MEELIARITSKVGIDAATAEKAVGMILAFLQKEGPEAEVQKLLAAFPGAEEAISQVKGGGFLSGLMGDFRRRQGDHPLCQGKGRRRTRRCRYRRDPGPRPVRLTNLAFFDKGPGFRGLLHQCLPGRTILRHRPHNPHMPVQNNSN